jgi:hypothetical protein
MQWQVGFHTCLLETSKAHVVGRLKLGLPHHLCIIVVRKCGSSVDVADIILVKEAARKNPLKYPQT